MGSLPDESNQTRQPGADVLVVLDDGTPLRLYPWILVDRIYKGVNIVAEVSTAQAGDRVIVHGTDLAGVVVM